MTFAISFGKWGGFYLELGQASWRLCLGWMAFTILFEDLDVWLQRYLLLEDCHDDHYQSMLELMKENQRLREKRDMLQGAVQSWLKEEEEWASEKRALYEKNEQLRGYRRTMRELDELERSIRDGRR